MQNYKKFAHILIAHGVYFTLRGSISSCTLVMLPQMLYRNSGFIRSNAWNMSSTCERCDALSYGQAAVCLR